MAIVRSWSSEAKRLRKTTSENHLSSCPVKELGGGKLWGADYIHCLAGRAVRRKMTLYHFDDTQDNIIHSGAKAWLPAICRFGNSGSDFLQLGFQVPGYQACTFCTAANITDAPTMAAEAVDNQRLCDDIEAGSTTIRQGAGPDAGEMEET